MFKKLLYQELGAKASLNLLALRSTFSSLQSNVSDATGKDEGVVNCAHQIMSEAGTGLQVHFSATRECSFPLGTRLFSGLFFIKIDSFLYNCIRWLVCFLCSQDGVCVCGEGTWSDCCLKITIRPKTANVVSNRISQSYSIFFPAAVFSSHTEILPSFIVLFF